MNVLELCLRNNFAGIENFRLYSETFFGTKYLIESYLSEVEEALAFVAASDKIAPEARRPFYRSVQKNMGRSALCLSGGGSFGYCECTRSSAGFLALMTNHVIFCRRPYRCRSSSS